MVYFVFIKCFNLGDIFNLSLRTGIFLAKVTPVFKDGNRNICGNYRPISVISVVAKVLEELIYQQVKSYMTKKNILVDLQSDFRAKHSTETTLLSSANQWLCNMDKGCLLKSFSWILKRYLILSIIQFYLLN